MTIATSPSALSCATPNNFSFEGISVRVITLDGEPWFVMIDVCKVLEIALPHRAADRLDEDEKGRHTVTTLGGRQNVTVINESGLYSLILSSRKEAARRFKKWVTAEVLPQIRKTGRYSRVSVRAHTRRRPSPVPLAPVMPEIQAYAVRQHLALLAQYLGRQGELGRRVTALENLLQGLHSFTGERDSRLIRVLSPDIAKDTAARDRFLATTQTPQAKPAESRPSIGYRPEEVFPSCRPAGDVMRERDPKPQPPEPQVSEPCGVRWDDPEAVEALLYSMRVKREMRRQPVPITPERAAELHHEGTIGPRQWARLARHIVRRIK